MIIECPSCKTRFSVDDDHVVRIDNPRFHCSRCDHYFFHQAKSPEPVNFQKQDPLPEKYFDENVNQETSFAADSPDEFEEMIDYHQTQLSFSDLSQDNDEAVKEANFSKESLISEDQPQFFASWPDQQTNSNYEADLSNIQSEFIRNNLFAKIKKEPVNAKKETSAPIAATTPVVNSLAEIDAITPANFRIETTEENYNESEERTKIISDLNKKNLLQRSSTFNFSAIYSCMIFLSFPLLAFLGIFSWSQNLSHTPPIIKDMLGIESNNFPYPPPLGLDVIDLHSNFINLDNGIKALEIKGMLHNATSKVYEDVMLDSRLFNQENMLLDRIIVNSNNKIVSAKVETLSAEAILDMQKSSSSNSQLKIGPNDKIPFRVMFFPYLSKIKDTDQIKWFSTRVYSTRATTS